MSETNGDIEVAASFPQIHGQPRAGAEAIVIGPDSCYFVFYLFSKWGFYARA